MSNKIKVGIAGGAGYTGGELLRILLLHPSVDLRFIHSKSNAKHPVYDVHTDLEALTDLHFTDTLQHDIDVLFLCVGHGEAKQFLEKENIPESVRIIDLSQDFRLSDPSHDFVYGLPEINKKRIQEARNVANPGCFATCIQHGLLPLAHAGLLNDDVHVNAITGSTGAGQKLTPTSHFSYREDNVSVYKVFEHQHLHEIHQSINQLQPQFKDDKHKIYFVPVRGNFTRGIFATSYVKTNAPAEKVEEIYNRFYENAPFVTVTGSNPSLKQVVNTNQSWVYAQKKDDMVLVISMIDNLLKGASGQAVQNMNLMFGLEESTGLHFKPAAF